MTIIKTEKEPIPMRVEVDRTIKVSIFSSLRTFLAHAPG